VSTIVVHGGCGNPRGDSLRDEADYHHELRAAVEAAAAVLRDGGQAIDAAQAAVESLEDAPQFNAGRGSVLAADGSVEMDAALMSGHDRRAGAVATVSTPRHAVALARAVRDTTPHTMLAGQGAERLAADAGVERMGPDWFITDRRREQWWKARGTVGAVVLDDGGRLAAATSTGGTTGQMPGRVGDSPLIGAGTWADDDSVAISCTGDGEAIIRIALAHEIDALMRHAGLPLAEACDRALAGLQSLGTAGLIAVGAEGQLAVPFTTPAMPRGWRVGNGPIVTAVGPDG
jgi:isoaspartyl peptidase/L-asparaginase-like protein (Ntn-hydrolase superfamily)